MIAFAKMNYPIPYIPADRRYDLLPEHSICSIAPADITADDFITGNGTLRVESAGRPYDDEMAYTQELLYEPLWEKTPLPPDLRPYLPRIRQLLLEGKPEETDKLLDEAQKVAGFDKYMNFDNKILYPTGSPRLHTAFWLSFKQPKQEKTWDYLRWLDMQNGMITSTWTNAQGVYRSEVFAAYDGDVIVNRFSAPQGKLDLEIEITLPGRPFGYGNVFFKQPFVKSTHELKITERLISLAWAYNPDFGHKGYAAAIRLIPQGGKLTATETGVTLTGGDGLIIVSKIVKFESDFTFACAQPVCDALLAMEVEFDKLLQGNQRHIGQRMDRSRIHLGKERGLRALRRRAAGAHPQR